MSFMVKVSCVKDFGVNDDPWSVSIPPGDDLAERVRFLIAEREQTTTDKVTMMSPLGLCFDYSIMP